MKPEPVGVALLGAGNFARRVHLPNLARMPEARLRLVCDPRREAAEAACRDFGADASETNGQRAFDDPSEAAVRSRQAGEVVRVAPPPARGPVT